MAVDDMDTRQHTPGEFAGRVGLVLQNPANQLSGMCDTVYEEVAFGLENLGVPRKAMPDRIERALQQVGLAEVHDRSPYDLSGGRQQRLALASVAMLEPRARRGLSDLLRDLPQAMLVATHDLRLVRELLPRTVVMDEGAVIADGPTSDILADAALLAAHGLEIS